MRAKENSEPLPEEGVVVPYVGEPVEEKLMTEPDMEEVIERSTESVERKNGEFRIQNKVLWLTYKHHWPKEELKGYIAGRFKSYVITEFIAAHETADKGHPYLHTHCLVIFSREVQSRNPRILDFKWDLPNGEMENVHPHIKCVRSAEYILNCKIYMAKEDPENEELLKLKKNVCRVLAQCTSVREALFSCAHRPSDIPGVIAGYNMIGKEVKTFPLKPRHFRRWQESAYTLVEKRCGWRFEPNEVPDLPRDQWKKPDGTWAEIPGDKVDVRGRQILVFWGPNGNDGKTAWMKTLVAHNPRRYFGINGIPPIKDLATLLMNTLLGQWTGEVLIFNVTRTIYESRPYMCQCIEAAIDGYLTAFKYQGGTVMYEPKAVIILTNDIPDLYKVTTDRWRCYKIESRLSDWRKLSYDELIEAYEQQLIAQQVAIEAKERPCVPRFAPEDPALPGWPRLVAGGRVLPN